MKVYYEKGLFKENIVRDAIIFKCQYCNEYKEPLGYIKWFTDNRNMKGEIFIHGKLAVCSVCHDKVRKLMHKPRDTHGWY